MTAKTPKYFESDLAASPLVYLIDKLTYISGEQAKLKENYVDKNLLVTEIVHQFIQRNNFSPENALPEALIDLNEENMKKMSKITLSYISNRRNQGSGYVDVIQFSLFNAISKYMEAINPEISKEIEQMSTKQEQK